MESWVSTSLAIAALVVPLVMGVSSLAGCISIHSLSRREPLVTNWLLTGLGCYCFAGLGTAAVTAIMLSHAPTGRVLHEMLRFSLILTLGLCAFLLAAGSVTLTMGLRLWVQRFHERIADEFPGYASTDETKTLL
jgi:hypothetical protein